MQIGFEKGGLGRKIEEWGLQSYSFMRTVRYPVAYAELSGTAFLQG